MPLIPYLLSLDLPRARFVHASNPSVHAVERRDVIGLGAASLMTVPVVAVSACGLVLVALGVRIGQRISRHLAPQAFRTTGLILRAVGWL